MPVSYALPYVKLVRERREAYEQDCIEWAKQGYRPHYCYHGTNMWVDWDCACGWCEDGMDTVHEEALRIAQNAWEKEMQAVRYFIALSELERELDVPWQVADPIRAIARDWMNEKRKTNG